MKKMIIAWCMLCTIVAACTGEKEGKVEQEQPLDTIPVMVMQIQKCSRLYTSEYKIHKIITHDDKMKLQGSIMKRDFQIDLPLGERRIAIPMDATVKAYVDFNEFSAKNIQRDGEKITITLHDPKLIMTSTKIKHQDVKQYVALTRSNFSEAELASYEQQGRQQIINSIPQMGVIENARKSAASTLIPLIASMGFKEENITVTFRKEFKLENLKFKD
jgi:hypothetical protein